MCFLYMMISCIKKSSMGRLGASIVFMFLGICIGFVIYDLPQDSYTFLFGDYKIMETLAIEQN